MFHCGFIFLMSKSLNSSTLMFFSFLNSHRSILDCGLPVTLNHFLLGWKIDNLEDHFIFYLPKETLDIVRRNWLLIVCVKGFKVPEGEIKISTSLWFKVNPIKLVFTKVPHLASQWEERFLQLGNQFHLHYLSIHSLLCLPYISYSLISIRM